MSDGRNISGSLTSNLTILSALTTDSASYSVIVANSISSTNSHVSIVTVGTPPLILASPASATNVAGHTATLTGTANGGGLSYQWIKGTAPVANSASHVNGAKSNILTFTGLLLTDAGSHRGGCQHLRQSHQRGGVLDGGARGRPSLTSRRLQ